MKTTMTRKMEFDAAHRVTQHGSKCRNLHGHRYVVEVTAEGALDKMGMVVDFGVVKQLVGGWIDEKLDHGTVIRQTDIAIETLCINHDWKLFVMPDGKEPTAENMAELLLAKSQELLQETGVVVTQVRVFETPNCWADARVPA